MKNVFIILFTSLALLSINAQAKPDKSNKLPPGLQKKAAKGKSLPPGWQKKLSKGSRLDKAVYDEGRVVVPIDDKGIITLRVEDKMIRLFKATREIVEVLQ